MEIYKTGSPDDIAAILSLQDDRLEDQIPCSKIEWNQWLMQNLDKENFLGIWVAKEDDLLLGYLVALNAMAPPISDSIMILYQSFFGAEDENEQHIASLVLEEIKKWAIEKGAKKISIVTKYPRINSRYGFETEGTAMVLNV